MLDKNKVKYLYLQGRNAVYIAAELNCNVDTVRKCIQRNLKEAKTEHLIAKQRDKEILRITRRESTKWMTDKDFIKRNPSIYKTNNQGDKILNRAVSGTVTFDTPRRINNEFSYDRVNKKIRNSKYKKINSYNVRGKT